MRILGVSALASFACGKRSRLGLHAKAAPTTLLLAATPQSLAMPPHFFATMFAPAPLAALDCDVLVPFQLTFQVMMR